MNTLSIPTSSRSLVWRFAWKEYRMLRGFWIAGLGIALSIQLLAHIDVLRVGTLAPGWYMMVAWSAAALYAVGAAITIFCAETEERTRDYLRLLPGDWKTIFSSKVLTALGTAVVLGSTLSIAGCWLAGSLPPQKHVLMVIGIAGVAVLEFFAWGLLFSLWWKHPLLAAVAAIAAASFGAQWAIVATTNANNSWTGEAYVEAVPGRLAICMIVFAVDVWLGRRWLYPVPTQGRAIASKPTSGLLVAKPTTGKVRPRLKMFGRLLWQTWRESWKAILLAVPLSFGLIAAFMAPASLLFGFNEEYALWSMSLFLPAIVGALVFRADQQKDHRLFLATHAAWPRYVWLARHVVWLGTVLMLATLATAVVLYLFQALMGYELLRTVEGYERYGYFDSHGSIANSIELGKQFLRSGIFTAWCAVISAYGVGQLCSMLLKRTVLSGFASLLLSVVLSAWSILMFAWQMNPWWFVLPIGIGAMLATWLRAPSWILGQNLWKHWVAPVAAALLPLVLAVAYVPTARMAQIEGIALPAYHYLREPLEVSTREFKERQKRLRESLLQLEQLGIAEEPWIEDVVLDGKKLSDYDLSERALEFYGPGRYLGYFDEHVDELDPTEVEILDRFQAEATRQGLEAIRAKIPELLAVINSPSFEPAYLRYWEDRDRVQRRIATLLASNARYLTANGELAEAWQCLRAIPLIDSHFRYNDLVFDFYKDVSVWAAHPGQTSERLKEAVVDMQQVFARLPSPRDVILDNRDHVRSVVSGEEPPRYASYDRLYFFLNQLPGEQSRALKALDLLTTDALNQIDAATALAIGKGPQLGMGQIETVGDLLRAWDREVPAEAYDGRNKERIQELRQAFSTSFLAESEFDYVEPTWVASNWVAEETRRRGLLVQLALMAYRLDYGTYPKTLAELTPGWLAEPITDPFSGEAFVYRPEGIPFSLIVNDFEVVPPNTPMIWSVGFDNPELVEAQLADFLRQAYETELAPERQAIAQGMAAGERYFYLRGTQRGGSIRFVFPLPKIELPDEQPAKE